ncbi:hypothetical protein H0X10_03045 [Candidatus Saccharibacteria bacterium]|nr:hypothetical protein [Candidatus Saccharibacteria bacterium]
MDHQAPDTLPSVELPRPEQEYKADEYTARTPAKTEMEASKKLEQDASAQSAATTLPQTSQNNPDPQAVPLVTPHTAPPTGVPGMAITPQIADDTDLIEKEWVDKAKQIVEHTRHDPHQQNKEMNIIKADYLKKRYNKDIKLSE